MKRFTYKTFERASGQITTGEFLAEDSTKARQALNTKDRMVIALTAKEESFLHRDITGFFSIPRKVVYLMYTELAILLNARIPVAKAVELIEHRCSNTQLKNILSYIHYMIESGESLSSAMKQFIHIFGIFSTSLVSIAEETGTLPQVLNEISANEKREQEMKRKVITSLIYPVFVLSFAAVMIMIIVLFIFPGVIEALEMDNIELPMLSKIVFIGADFIHKNFIFLLIFIPSVLFTIKAADNKFTLKKTLYTGITKVPIFKNFFDLRDIFQFTRNFYVLIKNRISVVEALRICGQTSSSEKTGLLIKAAAADVIQGKNLTSALERHKVLPLFAVEIIQAGEESGELVAVFKDLSGYFNELFNSHQERLTALVTPSLLIIVGAIIGFIVVALYLPILSMVGSIGN